ncbi:MAG: ABC transporter ATP-binding protein [Candidatus Kariarchaeaceae archaeon]
MSTESKTKVSNRSDSIILIENLTKYYGDQVGIENLTLTINKGEIFGFLGQNGAGKTTTIRCILNILIPDSGSIHVNDQLVSRDNPEIKEEIGYLPGEWYVPGGYTVGDFLDYIASLRKKPSDRIQEIAERIDLNLDRKIKQLSKGNKQKVGIVLAFMSDPSILILDEPTAGLDPLLQQEIYDLIDEEKEKGKTVFFSSHNLDEVQRICDRVAIIREGKLVSIEKVKELAEKVPRKLRALFTKITEKDLASLGDVVKSVNEETGEVEIEIFNGKSLSEILNFLTSLPLIDLSYPAASLEEYFLAKYQASEVDHLYPIGGEKHPEE